MLFFLLPFLLFACATQQMPPIAAPTNLVPIVPAPILEAAGVEEAEPMALQSSDLRSALSTWISENEDAEFAETARMANRLLRQFGYPLVLDAAKAVRRGKIRLTAGGKIFTFMAGAELSETKDVCGERYLRVPGRVLGPNRAALVSGGKEYAFSLEKFGREKFRIYREGKLLAVIPSPEPAEPMGLASNGRSLYLRFLLEEARTSRWWTRVAEHVPAVIDEDPYLVLRVEKGRLYFDENEEHLQPQEFEVEQNAQGKFLWRFLPSGLVVELPSKCSG